MLCGRFPRVCTPADVTMIAYVAALGRSWRAKARNRRCGRNSGTPQLRDRRRWSTTSRLGTCRSAGRANYKGHRSQPGSLGVVSKMRSYPQLQLKDFAEPNSYSVVFRSRGCDWLKLGRPVRYSDLLLEVTLRGNSSTDTCGDTQGYRRHPSPQRWQKPPHTFT
jgi:hypothetical protein